MIKSKRFFDKVKKISPFRAVLGVLLTLYALSMVVLLFWGVLNSLKSVSDFRTNPLFFTGKWPWNWSWSNYAFVFKNFQLRVSTVKGVRIITVWHQILYTLLYAGGCALVNVFVTCVTAYAVARFDFAYSKVLYVVALVTMMLPIVGSYPSEIQMLKTLGLYDTIWGSWIQKMNFLGLYFFVFHATFKSTAKEYVEAAKIDGAGEWRIFFRIMLPLVKVTFFIVVLIKFVEFWNDYQTPLLYMPSFPTLSVGIYHLSNSTVKGLNYVPMRMAGCVMLVLPVFILFICFRNRIMGNVSMGGVKE